MEVRCSTRPPGELGRLSSVERETEIDLGHLVRLDVRANAYDFLEESLRYSELATDDPGAWKFAIVMWWQPRMLERILEGVTAAWRA